MQLTMGDQYLQKQPYYELIQAFVMNFTFEKVSFGGLIGKMNCHCRLFVCMRKSCSESWLLHMVLQYQLRPELVPLK